MENALIGYDLGGGGGEKATPLPCTPTGIILITANQDWTLGETGGAAVVDIWGTDPRLNVSFACLRIHQHNNPNSYTPANLDLSYRAWPLFRTAEGVLTGPELSATDLFSNGGHGDDGCELVTAAQGIRIAVNFNRVGNTDVEAVAFIQVKPNVALGCAALLERLVYNLKVEATETRNPGHQ